jgi:hypothetical protein
MARSSIRPTSRHRFSGPELAEVLRQVHDEHGATATIAEVNRVRAGGIAGFFAREEFEVIVEADAVDPGRDSGDQARDDRPAGDQPWGSAAGHGDAVLRRRAGDRDEPATRHRRRAGDRDEPATRHRRRAGDRAEDGDPSVHGDQPLDDPADGGLAGPEGRSTDDHERPRTIAPDERFRLLLERALEEREEAEDLANLVARSKVAGSRSSPARRSTDRPTGRAPSVDASGPSQATVTAERRAGAGPGEDGEAGAGDGGGSGIVFGEGDGGGSGIVLEEGDGGEQPRGSHRCGIVAGLETQPDGQRRVDDVVPDPRASTTPIGSPPAERSASAPDPALAMAARPTIVDTAPAQSPASPPAPASVVVEPRPRSIPIGHPFWARLEGARDEVAPLVLAQPPVVGVVGPLRSIVPLLRVLERNDEGPGQRSVVVLTNRAEIVSQPTWRLVRDGMRLASAVGSADLPLALAIDVDGEGEESEPGGLPIWVDPLLDRLRRNGMGLVRVAVTGPIDEERLVAMERAIGGRVLFDLLTAVEPGRALRMLDAGLPIGSIVGVPVTAELLLTLRHEAGSLHG